MLNNTIPINETEKIRLYWIKNIEETKEPVEQPKEDGNINNTKEINITEKNIETQKNQITAFAISPSNQRNQINNLFFSFFITSHLFLMF